MSISTDPAHSDLASRIAAEAATRRKRGPLIYLAIGAIGLIAALFADNMIEPVAPGTWTGSDFGRALAQYRRFAWFDRLETALGESQHSQQRQAMIDRFSEIPDLRDDATIPDGVHLEVTATDVDLTGIDGLLRHVQKKGDAWERPAIARLYRDGTPIAESRAGLRVHGGSIRRTENIDYRLYFRRAYGAEPPPAKAIWPDGPEPLDRLVMKGGIEVGIANLVALETVRRLGGLASHATIGTSRLNGGPMKTGLVLEHLSPDWLDAHFGHRDFIFRRLKGGGRRGRGSLYVALEETVNRLPMIALSDVEHLIDMDGLIAQYIANLITRCADPFQGAIILDQTRQGAKWRFVAWDMEGAFPTTPAPDYVRTMGYPPGQTPILRAVLWRKLRSDVRFQESVQAASKRAVAELLTDPWIAKLTERLEKAAMDLPKPAMAAAMERISTITGHLRHNRDHLLRDLNALWAEAVGES